jgi:DNA transformation protein
MFGGAGIYARETIFAIAIDGVIYLKADAETVPTFEREGMAPFTFIARKKTVATSYWRMPDSLYDDPEELARWSRLALAVAERAAATKKSKRKKAPKG